MQNRTDDIDDTDDIAVNLDVVSCEKVMKTLNSFGLVAKDLQYLEKCRILGLRVQKEKGFLSGEETMKHLILTQF